ncbi:TetR/AcrR family transcriptional regulator [Mycolicibacterium llatzerense]|uniref:TetR/AcrR family transcriptional regulator n=1 Tax=Mycolicibacterium llatzerense TaxID=280871 RepID=UPI0021B53503|nr:TetR/AcrR family transcriptional regulator [Mycolicibacterium llatzerense]MCT7366441.1 TetR family transcriptional regulator [Mycolicibacterium llatzerense]
MTAQGRRGGSKGVPRHDREAQILDAAAIEFGERGYAAATTAAVAERAGVSKSLVHGYFQSKEGLYCACVRRAGEEVTGRVGEAMLLPGRSGLERATDVLAAIFTALEARPHDWRVLHDPGLAPGSEADQTARRYRQILLEQSASGVTGSYAATLRDPGDLSVLIQVWRNTVTALVSWWLRHPEQSATDMIARAGRLLVALEGPR